MLKIQVNNEKGTVGGLQVDPICSLTCDLNGDGLECIAKSPDGQTIYSNEGSPIVLTEENSGGLVNRYLGNQTLAVEDVPVFLRAVALAIENAEFTGSK